MQVGTQNHSLLSEQQEWRRWTLLNFRKYLESRDGKIWRPTDTRRVLEEVDGCRDESDMSVGHLQTCSYLHLFSEDAHSAVLRNVVDGFSPVSRIWVVFYEKDK